MEMKEILIYKLAMQPARAMHTYKEYLKIPAAIKVKIYLAARAMHKYVK